MMTNGAVVFQHFKYGKACTQILFDHVRAVNIEWFAFLSINMPWYGQFGCHQHNGFDARITNTFFRLDSGEGFQLRADIGGGIK